MAQTLGVSTSDGPLCVLTSTSAAENMAKARYPDAQPISSAEGEKSFPKYETALQ